MSDDTFAAAGEIYAETRARITELVGGLDARRAGTIVPATPAWTVSDVLAHMAGNCACIIEGRIDGVASDPWTAAQVEERKGRSLDELLDEWTQKAPQVEAMAGSWPAGMARMLVSDVATHEQDLRGALGVPGARDARGFLVSFESFAGGFGAKIAAAGLPALRLDCGDETVLGDGEPGASVAADRFEVTRAFAGRRSARQVEAFDWDTDPAPYVALFTPFTLRADDLVE